MTHIEVMKQALYNLDHKHYASARDFLNEAIAETEKQEPVAWMHKQGNYEEPSSRQLGGWEISNGWTQYPLYTHPQPKQTPLTDEQVENLIGIKSDSVMFQLGLSIVKATEKAHGIGEQK